MLGGARVNIHTHGSRCVNGSFGDIRCSLCYRRTLMERTTLVQLTEPRRSDDDLLRPVVGEMLEVELARPPIDVDAFLSRMLTFLPSEFASSDLDWDGMDVENEAESAAASAVASNDATLLSANALSSDSLLPLSSPAEADSSAMDTFASFSSSSSAASADSADLAG